MPESWARTHAAASPMDLHAAGFTKLLNEFEKEYVEFKSSCMERDKVYRVFKTNF